MKERDNILFYDTASLSPTPDIQSRAEADWLQQALQKRFPDEALQVQSVHCNDTGIYRRGLRKITNLPAFIDIRLAHKTGRHTEYITVWVPVRWNDRFIGTGGGGTATGGEQYITRPNNTSRGMTLPFAVMNGFAAATTDAANREKEWALDRESGTLDMERLENWHGRSTHFMTLAGKAVCELLHGRQVQYSYFHGGSGGGRQAMVLAQEYPSDYNGIWASCPAINWTSFLPEGLWPVAVMNSERHILSERRIRQFMEAAQNSAGGQDAYYRRLSPVAFDPVTLVGTNGITEADARIMKQLWDGPTDEAGNRLWYGFRPGVLFWNKVIPIGAFYYTLSGKPRPFFLSTYYLRWVTKNPKQTFESLTVPQYRSLHRQSVTELARFSADSADLHPFAAHGGKLMIDHGIDDPLIPVDGTLDYCRRMLSEVGADKAEKFFRLYITPGDGHGRCRWHAPGITEKDGMQALIAWVETGSAPQAFRTVQVGKHGDTLRTDKALPYTIQNHEEDEA